MEGQTCGAGGGGSPRDPPVPRPRGSEPGPALRGRAPGLVAGARVAVAVGSEARRRGPRRATEAEEEGEGGEGDLVM